MKEFTETEYEEEIDRCLTDYEKVFDFSEIENEWQRKTVAVMLENQKLFNETSGEIKGELDLVRKVYGNLKMPVAFFPMLYPKVSYKKLVFEAGTNIIKVEKSDSVANSICLQIDAEIYEDIRNNAGTVSVIRYQEDNWLENICNQINVVFTIMHKKVSHDKMRDVKIVVPLWMKSFFVEYEGLETIFLDVDGNDILLLMESDLESGQGYFYCPYVPFAWMDNGVFTRYAKRLKNSDFFGKVTVEGLPRYPLEKLNYDLAEQGIKHGCDYSINYKYGKTIVVADSVCKSAIEETAEKYDITIDRWFLY